MGLSILGVIPHFKGATNGKPRHHPGTQPVIEALRGIRLNLEHAYGAAGPLLVTVTSPGSGDGKSFLAANLALAFADAGRKTILIDGDGRRGALHRVLNAGRKPGLTDILSKRVSRDDAIQPTAYPSLSFVGSGTRLPSGPELLASGAMAELVTSLRGLYQTIIIDSPPLGAGVDAFALGTVTGNMVIVLRTGSTDREEAEAKLDLLDRLPVRVLGAVLNDVKGGKAYGYRYYSYYLPGYEHESEEESEAAGGARKGLLGGATR
jgi:capsular exopolysaccharide synthesis family protein